MLTGIIKAFVSYSHKDNAFVSLLIQSLERHGIQVWQDKRQIRVSERFDTRIYEAINASDIFIVVLSPAAIGSLWVKKEIERALEFTSQNRTFRIFPIVIETCELPTFFQNINFADFRSTFEGPFQKLIASIRRIDKDRAYESPFVSSPPYRDTSQHEAIRYYNLGILSYRQGDVKKSVEYFIEALRLNPIDTDVLYNLAIATYDLAMRSDDKDLFSLAAERYETGYCYVSCHQGQGFLEVVAALRIKTAEIEALTRPWFIMYSNGGFHAMKETATGNKSDPTVKKLCPW